MNVSMAPTRLCIGALLVAFFLPASPTAAVAANAVLNLVLSSTTLLQDGVLVGELVLSNTSTDPDYRPQSVFGVAGGGVWFHVQMPNGQTMQYGDVVAQVAYMFPLQACDLAPGEYVKHPVCLMRQGGNYIFHKKGHYRVRAEYRDRERVFSPWVDVEVLKGGLGYSRYERHTAFEQNMAFRDETWAAEHAGQIEEFGSYSREVAKLVIFNLGSKTVVGPRFHPQITASLDNARLGLSLARKYGMGVEMWEFLVYSVEHPESVDRSSGVVNTTNAYWF